MKEQKIKKEGFLDRKSQSRLSGLPCVRFAHADVPHYPFSQVFHPKLAHNLQVCCKSDGMLKQTQRFSQPHLPFKLKLPLITSITQATGPCCCKAPVEQKLFSTLN